VNSKSGWWVYAGLCAFGAAVGMMEYARDLDPWASPTNALLLSGAAYILARQWEARDE